MVLQVRKQRQGLSALPVVIRQIRGGAKTKPTCSKALNMVYFNTSIFKINRR